MLYGNDFREMANRLKATVFSPEYTLTTDPSYTYHIELDEVYAGLTYVHEHGDELKVDGDNIVIMGESAGGGLTWRTSGFVRGARCASLLQCHIERQSSDHPLQGSSRQSRQTDVWISVLVENF